MGKQRADVRAFKMRPAPQCSLLSPAIRGHPWSLEWICRPLSQSEIAEDGHVLVTVVTQATYTTLVCGGVLSEGNSFLDLILQLRAGSLISNKELVGNVLVFKNDVWQPINMLLQRFRSGERIMVTVKPSKFVKPRKRLHKPLYRRDHAVRASFLPIN